MSLYCDGKKIIDTSRFNLEASDSIHNKIENSKSGKIIITGTRYSGKTTTLMSYEKLKLNNECQAIYTLSDNNDYDSFLQDDEMVYKYELLLSFWLLDYVKKYYSKIYEKDYIDIFNMVNKRYIDFMKMINLKFRTSVDEYLNLLSEWERKAIKPGDILILLIEKIKKDLVVDKLTLIIDRFDWVGCSSARFQKLAKIFLEMFDKYIVTSDDIYVLNGYNRREQLRKNGFEIIDVDYGKNTDIAKDIVSKDIDYWVKQKRQRQYSFVLFRDIKEIISLDAYDELIKRCGGDFGMLFDSIRPLFDFSYVECKDKDVSILKYQIDSAKARYEDELHFKPKTLHL